MIDERATIDVTAVIGPNVTIGPWAVIGPHVEIGEGTEIAPHAVICRDTKIGKYNKIHHFVVLGGDPQHTSYQGEQTFLEIGDHNILREFCTIHRGTPQNNGITRVGSHNYFMAYSHVAHDCIVGNEVVLANNASLAGHVTVEDFVMFGAFCGVHQFVTIGSYSFLGRATKVGQDIPPYLLVTGNPGSPKGLNSIGLKRRGFDEQTLRALRRAYSLVYRQGTRLTDAISELEKMVVECPRLDIFIKALQNTKRGIAR